MKRSSSTLLTPPEQQAVDALGSQLRERFPGRILQMILFGSKARGDSREWSDIDVLILVDDEDWPLRQEISTVASRVSLEYDVLIGPRVIGQERWERMKQRGLGLYQNVAAEGIPLSSSPH